MPENDTLPAAAGSLPPCEDVDLIGRTIVVLIDPPTEYPIVADSEFDIHRNFKESTARGCLMNPKLYALRPLAQGERAA